MGCCRTFGQKVVNSDGTAVSSDQVELLDKLDALFDQFKTHAEALGVKLVDLEDKDQRA